jgi:hypothetical protein
MPFCLDGPVVKYTRVIGRPEFDSQTGRKVLLIVVSHLLGGEKHSWNGRWGGGAVLRFAC